MVKTIRRQQQQQQQKKFVSIQKELKGNYSLIILEFGFGLYQPDGYKQKDAVHRPFKA